MNLLKVHQATFLQPLQVQWLENDKAPSLSEFMTERCRKTSLDHLFKVREVEEERGSFVTFSTDLSAVMHTPHHNVLRALKSFETHCGVALKKGHQAKGFSLTGLHRVPGMRAVRTKNDAMRGVVLWLPALQTFIKWLLQSLKGHDGVVMRRTNEFIAAYGFTSGLVRRGNDPTSPLLPGLLAAWPDEVNRDETTMDVLVLQPELQGRFRHPFDDETTSLTSLSKLLGYTEKHLRRQMRTTLNEFPQPEGDFLKVDEKGHVSRKTAVFLLLSVPKAISVRLMLFNELFQRSGSPRVAALPSGPGAMVDFNDPQAAQKAFLALESRLDKTMADSAQMVSGLQADKTALDSQLRQVQADLQGKEATISSLKAGMTNITTVGSILSPEHSDTQVHRAADLRALHGLIGMKDMLTSVLAKFGGIRLNELFVSSRKPIRNCVLDTLRYTAGYKLLGADGAPALRESIVRDDIARRFRVFIPSHCSAGRQMKHGDERNWEWTIMFTPAGVTHILDNFEQLAAKWVGDGSPKHMITRE